MTTDRLTVTGAIVASILTLSGARAAATPLGLPPLDPAGPRSNTTQAASLGKHLFFDKHLSADGTISCATCHDPQKAFTDGLPIAKGLGGRNGTRNTPSLWNVVYATAEFWDGRRPSLEMQAADPLLNPREHGLPNSGTLLRIVRNDADHRREFLTAYRAGPQAITLELIAAALAAFERTLVAGDSPFDRYSYAGERTALSESAIRGLQLFRGRAQCATCHLVGEQSALFTDHLYHSLGVGLKNVEPRLVEATTRVINAPAGTLDQLLADDADIAALGRFVVTLQPRDIGKFKTPSLRNVALTAPYMHDGSSATLAQAVDVEVYYRGLETGTPLILTPQEKLDLLAFLDSLTSPTGVRTVR